MDETRKLLADALVDMSETNLLSGESLPAPNPNAFNEEANLEEPIYLILNASSQVKVVPKLVYEAA